MVQRVLLSALSVLLLMPPAAAAQTPVATPQLATGRPHMVAFVARTFESPAVGPSGSAYFVAQAALTDAPDRASGALHAGVSFYRQFIEEIGGTVREASAPRIGDERIALAAEKPGEDDGSETQIGVLMWRDGSLVITLFAAAPSGEQLPTLFAIARAIEGRQLGSESLAGTPVPNEMQSGGIWDVLPTLDDMPEGYVFVEDEVL